MAIRLLKRSVAAAIPKLNAFAQARQRAVQTDAAARVRWLELVQLGMAGTEPDEEAVQELMQLAEVLGLPDAEQAFRADVGVLAALAAAESQLATMQAPRPGEVVAGEIKEVEARLRQLKHEQQRVAVAVQGRAVLRGEVEKLRARLPERLTKGGA
jgi:sulfur carrier protein ThiS